MMNFQLPTKQHSTKTVFIPYTPSEIAALHEGYLEIMDDRAFNQRCFVKNGKKWIHNLEALRTKLNQEYGRYIDDDELAASQPEGFAYDVENYYARYPEFNPLSAHETVISLLEQVKIN